MKGKIIRINIDDYIGKKFGKWEILSENIVRKGKLIKHIPLCRCECGIEKYVDLQSLKMGVSKGCRRCGFKSRGYEQKSTGRYHNPLKLNGFNSFVAMIQRCYNKNNQNYEYYGGRGIKVCERWLAGFNNFIYDMGERPSLKHSIDRIDTNGCYEPNNCKWATQAEQSMNRRSNIKLDLGGVIYTPIELSCLFGITPQKCRRILKKLTNEELLSKINIY